MPQSSSPPLPPPPVNTTLLTPPPPPVRMSLPTPPLPPFNIKSHAATTTGMAPPTENPGKTPVVQRPRPPLNEYILTSDTIKSNVDPKLLFQDYSDIQRLWC